MMQTLLTTCPNEVALMQSSTSGATHQHSQGHHAITTGQHISHSSGASILSSAAKHIRAFAQQGIRLMAGKDKVQIQANDNSIQVIAHQVIDLLGKDGVHLASEKFIRLQVGAHMVQMTPAGGIEFMSPQALKAQTSSMALDAPQSAAALTSEWPADSLNEMFVLRNQHGKPMAHFPYVIEVEDGRVIRGKTDKLGQAERIYTGDKPLKMKIGPDTQN